MFYDGTEEFELTLTGASVWNDGPLYIGRDPWYDGPKNWGLDNLQIHNRPLTKEEITQIMDGGILYNENLVMGFDFDEGVTDGKVYDVSNFENNGDVDGNPSMAYEEGYEPEGGAGGMGELEPSRERGPLEPQYLLFDGTTDMITIPHSYALELGKDDSDFSVSFDLLLTTAETGAWLSFLHKGNNDEERTPFILRYPNSN